MSTRPLPPPPAVQPPDSATLTAVAERYRTPPPRTPPRRPNRHGYRDSEIAGHDSFRVTKSLAVRITPDGMIVDIRTGENIGYVSLAHLPPIGCLQAVLSTWQKARNRLDRCGTTRRRIQFKFRESDGAHLLRMKFGPPPGRQEVTVLGDTLADWQRAAELLIALTIEQRGPTPARQLTARQAGLRYLGHPEPVDGSDR